MARQPSYRQLFRVGERVEVAQAPLDGETTTQWLAGRVIRITTRLHVQHCKCLGRCNHGHMAYERAIYNRGQIRKARAAGAS